MKRRSKFEKRFLLVGCLLLGAAHGSSDKSHLWNGLRTLIFFFCGIFLFITPATAGNLISYKSNTFGATGNAISIKRAETVNSKFSDGLFPSSASETVYSVADSSTPPDSILVHGNDKTDAAFPPPSERTVETLFWHDIAIYNWYTRINIQQPLSSQWQIGVTENFVSTLQKDSDRLKDDQTAQVRLRRKPWEESHWLGGWQWEIAMDSKIFRDDFSRQAINTRNNDFSLGGVYSRLERRLRHNLHVAGQAGYRIQHLLGQKDHGPNFGFSVALAPTAWQNYYHHLDAEAERNKLSDRRNEDVNVSYGISRQFENQTSDSLSLHFSQLRRENYFSDAGTRTLYIDLLQRERRTLENRLHYRINDAWQFLLRTELGESRVNVSRRNAEQKADEFQHTDYDVRHNAQVRWQRARLSNEWALQFFSQSIDYSDQAGSSPLGLSYPGVGYDSKDWHFVFDHRLRWRLGRRDSFRWYGSAVRYAHDTGNLRNRNDFDHRDDFDRLIFQANLLYGHRFAGTFLMQWEAHAYLEHHVYLKKTHSAGNNWRRVFKLQPSFIFDLAPGLYLKQSFGVQAQYIVYDFPEPLSLGQSNVFRNFFIVDSLALRLSRQTHGVVQYQFRLQERGILDWANWRQRPWLDRDEHWVSVVFDHQPTKFWQFAPGVTYWRQKDWRYTLSPPQGLKRQSSGSQTILSPSLLLSYARSPKAVVILSARRQIVFHDLTKSSSINHFRLTVQWSI